LFVLYRDGFRADEIIERRNQTKDNNSVIICGNLQLDIVARSVKINESLIKLTATEYNLLCLLARNEGKVLTHQYILKEIWGSNFQSETQYLRVFIAQLRKKIETNPNKPQHILTESGVGYRFY